MRFPFQDILSLFSGIPCLHPDRAQVCAHAHMSTGPWGSELGGSLLLWIPGDPSERRQPESQGESGCGHGLLGTPAVSWYGDVQLVR